jgi:DNA-binding CsgD family transcriptional regulator
MDRRTLAAESRIRELACHGLGGPMLAPLLFEQLQAVLPFANCGHGWLAPGGPPVASFHDPGTASIVQRYSDAYFRQREAAVWMTVDEAARAQMGPHHFRQGLRVPLATYHRNPMYGEIARPAGLHNFLRFVVEEKGMPVSFTMLGRDCGERDFDADELRRLTRLAPFIASALNAKAAPDRVDDCGEETAVLVMDADAQVRWASAHAHRLLWLAAGHALPQPGWPQLPALAASNLALIRRGDGAATPPRWVVRNDWGSFACRAYWLTPQEPDASLIGLTIEHRVPRAMRAMRQLHDLGLPRRQVEVGVRMALGRTDEQIAGQLGISRNTVVYHRRQIYNRLGVGSRRELADRLFGAPNFALPDATARH